VIVRTLLSIMEFIPAKDDQEITGYVVACLLLGVQTFQRIPELLRKLEPDQRDTILNHSSYSICLFFGNSASVWLIENW
jgi:hypothetical protein